jgi:microcystin-dependent protein
MADPVAPNPDADGLVGAITVYAGETLPGPKYRWCHGTQTLSRTEFSLLFSRLGELWGAGDGSTTFALPNMDKRVPAGIDSTGADAAFDKVGDTGGTAASSLPDHTHTAGTLAVNPHTHSGGADTPVASPGAGAAIGVAAVIASSQTGSASPGLTGSTGSTGSGSGDNWPPYAAVRYIIKVS